MPCPLRAMAHSPGVTSSVRVTSPSVGSRTTTTQKTTRVTRRMTVEGGSVDQPASCELTNGQMALPEGQAALADGYTALMDGKAA